MKRGKETGEEAKREGGRENKIQRLRERENRGRSRREMASGERRCLPLRLGHSAFSCDSDGTPHVGIRQNEE